MAAGELEEGVGMTLNAKGNLSLPLSAMTCSFLLTLGLLYSMAFITRNLDLVISLWLCPSWKVLPA